MNAACMPWVTYVLIVVTNQSGVAPGLFSEGALADVEAKLRQLLLAGFYYCSHYRRRCPAITASRASVRKVTTTACDWSPRPRGDPAALDLIKVADLDHVDLAAGASPSAPSLEYPPKLRRRPTADVELRVESEALSA